jgi:hypothetical protein
MLAGPQLFARDIAVDDDAVYWSLHTDPSGAPPGKVMRMTKDRASVTVLADAQWNVARLLTSDGFVYWAVGDHPPALRRAPGSGGPVQDVVTSIQHPSMGAIDLDDDAYFVAAEKSIYRIPRAGGAPVQIATRGETPSSISVDDTHVYWMEMGPAVVPPQPACKRPPCPVATVAPRFPSGELHRVPKAGGASDIPVKGISEPGRTVTARGGTVIFSSERGVERWDRQGLPSVVDGRKGFVSRAEIVDGELFLEQGNEIVAFR